MQSVFQIKCIKIQSKIKIKEKRIWSKIINQRQTLLNDTEVVKSMPQSIGISIILIILIIIIIIISVE